MSVSSVCVGGVASSMLFIKNFKEKWSKQDIQFMIEDAGWGVVHDVKIRPSRRNVRHAIVWMHWDNTITHNLMLQNWLDVGETLSVPGSGLRACAYVNSCDTKCGKVHETSYTSYDQDDHDDDVEEAEDLYDEWPEWMDDSFSSGNTSWEPTVTPWRVDDVLEEGEIPEDFTYNPDQAFTGHGLRILHDLGIH